MDILRRSILGICVCVVVAVCSGWQRLDMYCLGNYYPVVVAVPRMKKVESPTNNENVC
jgi:hypothetical protein